MQAELMEYYQSNKDCANFKPKDWVEYKIKRINDWFSKANLDSVIIGISGGIDSAVTFKLFKEASKRPGSPLKKVFGMILPITNSNGSTGQIEAKNDAIRFLYESMELCRYKDYDVVDLGSISNTLSASLQTNPYLPNAFFKGQLDYTLRLPALYGKAALFQSQGYKCVLCGTINRSEYNLGYFSQYIDVLDFNVLQDLWKSDVFTVAEFLEIPDYITKRTPNGNQASGLTDEEDIGVPYWFVEFYFDGFKDLDHNPLFKKYFVDPVIEQWIAKIQKRVLDNHFKFRTPLTAVLL